MHPASLAFQMKRCDPLKNSWWCLRAVCWMAWFSRWVDLYSTNRVLALFEMTKRLIIINYFSYSVIYICWSALKKLRHTSMTVMPKSTWICTQIIEFIEFVIGRSTKLLFRNAVIVFAFLVFWTLQKLCIGLNFRLYDLFRMFYRHF